MPIELEDHGQDNRLEIADAAGCGALRVIFRGSGNRLQIAPGCRFDGGHIELGQDCSFSAGPDCQFSRAVFYAARGASLQIGAGCRFTWTSYFAAHEPARIELGAGCLIASDCYFSSSDMHSVIDRRSGLRLNRPGDVVLGDRVWLGDAVRVLKGVSIGHGCVIGTAAVVTRSIPDYCLAAGVPARVIRRDISWDEALLDRFAEPPTS